jgi:hypothetical protein
MDEMRNPYKILVRNLKRRNHSDHLVVEGE